MTVAENRSGWSHVHGRRQVTPSVLEHDPITLDGPRPPQFHGPVPEVCPFCATDEEVTSSPLGPGLVEYTCSRARRHPAQGPYSWQGRVIGAPALWEEEAEGPATELGMLDDLLACVEPGEPWLEYGIIERRYRERSPDEFEQLVQRWGHREDGRQRPYTASAYIGGVLAMLRRRNKLVSLPGGGPATAYWSYNAPASYWARPPGPPRQRLLTFVAWAREHGHDPQRP
jgi:hypothetical protein